ncbi:hypothetical protein AB0I22_29020 [Streptomyces sp. NPDC050610]
MAERVHLADLLDHEAEAEELPLDQAVLAHRKMDAGEVFGGIVLRP